MGIRNSEWQNDEDLKANLQRYVLENLRRDEVLDFVKRDLPAVCLVLRNTEQAAKPLWYTLLKYIDCTVTVEEVEATFREEDDVPGKLLGYRAL